MNKKVEVSLWDCSEVLRNDRDIYGLLDVAYEEGDLYVIMRVIEYAAKARFMSNFAKRQGISRNELYKYLTDCDPKTIPDKETILNAFGFDVKQKPQSQQTQRKNHSTVATKTPNQKPTLAEAV